MYDTLTSLSDRLTDRIADVRQRLPDRGDVDIDPASRLSRRQARLAAASITGIALSSTPAAAQSAEELGSVMCGSGVGHAIGLGVIGASMYFLLKSILRGMSAMDKMGSTREEEVREGRRKLNGAALSFAAAFVPTIAAGVFELLGVNTLSCLAPGEWAIIGFITVTPF